MTRQRIMRREYARSLMVALGALVVLLGTGRPALAQSVGEMFRAVAPSVVIIHAKGGEVTAEGERRFTETGSGVLISADGKVMTAAHVVHSMDEISVETLRGDSVTARVIASEPAADLSLLQLDRLPAGAIVAPLGDSTAVRVGDQVLIVGAPYGLGHSLSVGWISARWEPNTVYRAMPLAEFFQTDAVINTGNSGGPMFNMGGEVIGIVSHNISKSGGSEGLGFVVTVNTAKALLLEKRSFWTGIEGLVLSNEMSDWLNLPPKTNGFAVKTVAKGSPAEAMGLRGSTRVVKVDGQELPLGGDIILSVEGVSMLPSNYAKVREVLMALTTGREYTVKILRAGQVMELTGRAP